MSHSTVLFLLVISTVALISSDDPCDFGPIDLDIPTVALDKSSIDSVSELGTEFESVWCRVFDTSLSVAVL